MNIVIKKEDVIDIVSRSVAILNKIVFLLHNMFLLVGAGERNRTSYLTYSI